MGGKYTNGSACNSIYTIKSVRYVLYIDGGERIDLIFLFRVRW